MFILYVVSERSKHAPVDPVSALYTAEALKMCTVLQRFEGFQDQAHTLWFCSLKPAPVRRLSRYAAINQVMPQAPLDGIHEVATPAALLLRCRFCVLTLPIADHAP